MRPRCNEPASSRSTTKTNRKQRGVAAVELGIVMIPHGARLWHHRVRPRNLPVQHARQKCAMRRVTSRSMPPAMRRTSASPPGRRTVTALVQRDAVPGPTTAHRCLRPQQLPGPCKPADRRRRGGLTSVTVDESRSNAGAADGEGHHLRSYPLDDAAGLMRCVTARPAQRQRGVAAVEFALVAGLFFMLLIGIMEDGACSSTGTRSPK